MTTKRLSALLVKNLDAKSKIMQISVIACFAKLSIAFIVPYLGYGLFKILKTKIPIYKANIVKKANEYFRTIE